MNQNHDEVMAKLRNMEKLLYGDPTTGKGGMAQNLITVGDTVFGSERNPGGLVADMASLKKFMYLLAGAVTFAQFAIQVLFHFWKP